MAILYYVEKASLALKLGDRLGLMSVIHPADVRGGLTALAEGEGCVATLEVFNGDIRIPAGCVVMFDPAIRPTNERGRAEVRAFLCDARAPSLQQITDLHEHLRMIEEEAPRPFGF